MGWGTLWDLFIIGCIILLKEMHPTVGCSTGNPSIRESLHVGQARKSEYMNCVTRPKRTGFLKFFLFLGVLRNLSKNSLPPAGHCVTGTGLFPVCLGAVVLLLLFFISSLLLFSCTCCSRV